jgi:hypothetical protein
MKVKRLEHALGEISSQLRSFQQKKFRQSSTESSSNTSKKRMIMQHKPEGQRPVRLGKKP